MKYATPYTTFAGRFTHPANPYLMPYPAIVVANELIKLAKAENILITPMKLQKMLYLANGISLKRKGEKLISDRFEAWEYGPVVRSVYQAFKEYRGVNIPEPAEVLVPTGLGYGVIPASSISVTDTDLSIINEAWDNAKELDAATLSTWSHNKNTPWDKAFNAQTRQVYISDEEMMHYFENFIKE